MDTEKILDWCFGIGLFLLFAAVPVLVGFLIYKEIHCWGLDPKTAPIECQNTHTLNVNE